MNKAGIHVRGTAERLSQSSRDVDCFLMATAVGLTMPSFMFLFWFKSCS